MNKKIRVVLLSILAVIFAAVAFSACGNDTQSANSSPESVVKAYIDAGNKGDASKMADCFYFETKAEKDAAKEALKLMFFSSQKSEKMETRKFTTEKDGDTAVVTFECREKGSDDVWEEVSFECIRVKGEWYLDFSSLFGGF